MPATLTDEARLVLLELEAPPSTPISSAELAKIILVMTPRQVGARLRELRTAGLATPLDAQTLRPLDRVPPGTRVVWAPRAVWRVRSTSGTIKVTAPDIESAKKAARLTLPKGAQIASVVKVS